MINISNTKVMTLTVITPPDTDNVKTRTNFQPGEKWSSIQMRLPTPELAACPFQHYSLEDKGVAIESEHQFNESCFIYGVFDGTITVTLHTDTDVGEIKMPVVPGTSIRSIINNVPPLRKKGFVLEFWSLDQDTAADPLHRVLEDTDLYAVWIEQQTGIKLTFETGELFEAMPERYVESGAQWSMIQNSIEYPTPAAMGNYFKHWSLSSGGEEIPSATLFNEATTIYAVGDTTTSFIDLTFNTHGGTNINPLTDQPSGIIFGYVKQLISDPTRKTDEDRPDEFAGWALEPLSDAPLDAKYSFTKTTQLHAQWVHRIDLTIKNNGEDRVISYEANYWPYSEALEQLECDPEGIPPEHTFKHWSLTSDGPDMGTEGKFAEDTDVYAVYDPYAVITFDAQEGAGATPEIKVPINTTWANVKGQVTPPTREEHTFKHWSLSQGGEAIEDQHPFAGEVTVYAVWIPYIQINFNTGSGTAVDAIKVPYNSAWSTIKEQVGETTQTGYRFSHWSKEDGGTTVMDDDTFTETTTLYAVWVKTWTVTFDTDGGTPTQEPLTVDDGTQWSQIKSKVTNPSKSGQNFIGWSVKE